MSSSIPIIQSLTYIANSANYCQPIKLNTKMEHYEAFECDYQSISNNIEIIPPSVWFSIEESKCFASIRNDIERSRTTREGLLSTNLKGNLLNKISYQGYEEDIGTIQETEQSFCVAFAVVKDSCEQFIKQIGSELRACLIKKSSLIDRSHLKISQLDDISKQIYSKYRIFLIFDTRSQPGRVISFHSCFYPNVRFTLEKIKKKDGVKFSPNEVFQQIQRVQLLNTFGLLSLDKKMRLLMVKRDDPELNRDSLVGVWVISSYHSSRTKKQFAKEDAIWAALLDFYTNPDAKIKISVQEKQRGFLCYFGFKKQKSKLDRPEFYLFEPSSKNPPKWSFAIKNEVLSQSNKSCQIKIEFMNSTIVEQRQYSQFSDQNNNYEEMKLKNQNSNMLSGKQQRRDWSNQFQSNESGLSGSSQGKGNQPHNKNTRGDEDEQKNRIIKELREQLEKYKQRCAELQAVNKILIQQKMMNPMMYPPQYPMMGQLPPMYHQFNQMPNFPYPLSYSQVSNQNYSMGFPPENRPEVYKPNNSLQPIQNRESSQQLNLKNIQNRIPQETQPIQKQKPVFSFPETQEQEITFGSQKNNQILEPKQKLFVKKSQSYGTQLIKQEEKIDRQRENERQKANKQINVKKDFRNISFQDSFAEYHSEGEEEGAYFKNGQPKFGHFLSKDLQKSDTLNEFSSSKKRNVQKDQESDEGFNANINKSPQFKRLYSLQSQTIPNVEQQRAKKFQMIKQQTEIKDDQAKDKKSEKNLMLKKSPEKSSSKQQIEPAKRQQKKIQSSSEQQEYQKQKVNQNLAKPKPTEKEQKGRKPAKVISDSDDSDEDEQMKTLRKEYLKR